jgi:hypothetical protein
MAMEMDWDLEDGNPIGQEVKAAIVVGIDSGDREACRQRTAEL